MRVRRTSVGLHGALCLLVFYFCFPTAAAEGEEAYSQEGFPDPGNSLELAACGVTESSFICDPSKILRESDLNRLNTLISSLRNVSSCLCDQNGPCHKTPYHIFEVALVPRIKYSSGGFPNTSYEEIALVRSFAEHLRDVKWNISSATCPLVAIIVLDLHTKRIWTATNYFARKVITDTRAEKVGLGAKDQYFKQDLIYLGLEDMISNYKQFFKEGVPGTAWWVILLVVLGFTGGAALTLSFICCARSGGGGGGVWSSGGGGGDGGGCGGGGGGCGGGGGG